MDTDERDIWVCMDCGARQDEPGKCRRCGEDPLLDLRQPQTREMLVEDDTHRRNRRQDKLRYAVVPVAIVLTVLMAVYVPGVNRILLSLPFFTGYPVGMALLALGMIVLFNKAFPYQPRFPYAAP